MAETFICVDRRQYISPQFSRYWDKQSFQSYRYAALKDGATCQCLNTTDSVSPRWVDGTQCQNACAGDGSLTCGGNDAQTLYDLNLDAGILTHCYDRQYFSKNQFAPAKKNSEWSAKILRKKTNFHQQKEIEVNNKNPQKKTNLHQQKNYLDWTAKILR